MKAFVPISLLLLSLNLTVKAQTDSLSAMADIQAFQNHLNDEYKEKDTSPLEPSDRKHFKEHQFFSIDLNYRVNAKLILTPGTDFMPLKTTTTRIADNRIYGYLEFSVAGKSFRVPVYQTKSLMNSKEYADYLFFPFSDLTNGISTYGGGRFIDLRIPAAGDNIVVDFNQAYNPYCAYNHKFSCPLVPAENQLDVAIEAGVKLDQQHK